MSGSTEANIMSPCDDHGPSTQRGRCFAWVQGVVMVSTGDEPARPQSSLSALPPHYLIQHQGMRSPYSLIPLRMKERKPRGEFQFHHFSNQSSACCNGEGPWPEANFHFLASSFTGDELPWDAETRRSRLRLVASSFTGFEREAFLLI